MWDKHSYLYFVAFCPTWLPILLYFVVIDSNKKSLFNKSTCTQYESLYKKCKKLYEHEFCLTNIFFKKKTWRFYKEKMVVYQPEIQNKKWMEHPLSKQQNLRY